MKNKTIEKRVKEFREKYEGANTGGAISSFQMDSMAKDIKDSMLEAQKQTEKAFGGCVLCFGKGFFTYRYGYSYGADFEGDKRALTTLKTRINPCTCDRGKQLRELLKDTDLLTIGIT